MKHVLRKAWLGAVAAAMLVPATGTLAQTGIEGTWMTLSKSEITISRCPEGFCGHISKVVVSPETLAANKDAAAMAVEDYVDQKNKDPNLRKRPILGLQILTLKPGNKPAIFDGSIYNPEDGNTYSGYVEMLESDVARLNGCILYNIICKGEDWIRVEESADATVR